MTLNEVRVVKAYKAEQDRRRRHESYYGFLPQDTVAMTIARKFKISCKMVRAILEDHRKGPVTRSHIADCDMCI